MTKLRTRNLMFPKSWFNNLNINENMLPELIKKIFDFIVPNKNPECDKIINSAIKLVMFQPLIQKEVKKCQSVSFRPCGSILFFLLERYA